HSRLHLCCWWPRRPGRQLRHHLRRIEDGEVIHQLTTSNFQILLPFGSWELGVGTSSLLPIPLGFTFSYRGLTVSDSWKVHKFGGSSVADAACMARVASILEADPAPSLAVVLYAARGVTDAPVHLICAGERHGD